jgi:signal transduction histidine kinase
LSDDGQVVAGPGSASLQSGKHFGLVGISERVALPGGSMQIETSPGGGFSVRADIPRPHPGFES